MGVSVQYLLPYILSHKCNTCTTNLGQCGYLLKSTTPPITLDKDVDTTPTPLLPVVSVLTPAPMTDVCVITTQSDLMTDSTFTLSSPETQLLQTLVSDLVEPILDVRVDFVDTCQIDRSGNRWFLLFVDKKTEYVSIYNTKTRSNPLALLKEFLTFTYNHTDMCRVESYIGVVKSHGHVSILNVNVTLRFHGDTV